MPPLETVSSEAMDSSEKVNGLPNGAGDADDSKLVNPEIAALERQYMEALQRRIKSLDVHRATEEKNTLKGSAISFTLKCTDVNTIVEKQDDHEEPKSTKDADSDASSETDKDKDKDKDKVKDKDKEAVEGGKDETEGASDKDSTSSRIRYRESRYNDEGVVEETDVDPAKKTSKSEKPKCAVEVLRVFDKKDQYESTEYKVIDSNLNTLLLWTLAHEPVMRHFKASEPIYFYSPFSIFVRSWGLLQDFISQDPSKPIVQKIEKLRRKPVGDLAVASKNSEQDLHALAGETAFKTAVSEMKLLLEEAATTPGMQSYIDSIPSGLDVTEKRNTVNWKSLWTIFPTGELVVTWSCMKQPQVCIVWQSFEDSKIQKDGNEFWVLHCWAYDWNGTKFERVPVAIHFEHFKDEKLITSLSCYPLKYHVNGDGSEENLKTKLIERGKKFVDYCTRPPKNRLLAYKGIALSRGQGFQRIGGSKTVDEDSASTDMSASRISSQKTERTSVNNDMVIVDAKAYLELGPNNEGRAPMGDLKPSDAFETEERCRCSICKENPALIDNQKSNFDNWEPEHNKEMEAMQYLICPPRVLGFWLRNKRWVELEVDKLQEVLDKDSDEGFNKLQLKQPQKGLIFDLVRNHTSGDQARNVMTDLDKGKGNGLVILLHGPPGVGKTSTAECLAQATGRPLIPINVSDIGLKPAEVEFNLPVLFELAAGWQAIMLFDEADVFLESRANNTAHLGRNALVSVLLRVLEHFSGILILTTNRMRSIDVAVQSRINFAIRYDHLDDVQKREIYRNFISQLTDENADKTDLLQWIEEEQITEPPFKKLNGRQIRNVLFSAATLAAGPNGDGRLKRSHIRQILRQTKVFQDEVNFLMEEARKGAEVGYIPNLY